MYLSEKTTTYLSAEILSLNDKWSSGSHSSSCINIISTTYKLVMFIYILTNLKILLFSIRTVFRVLPQNVIAYEKTKWGLYRHLKNVT